MLPQAFTIGRDFIAGEPVALVLGDNLFFGATLTNLLERAAARTRGATIFTYRVDDPGRYGASISDDASHKLAGHLTDAGHVYYAKRITETYFS